MQELAHTIPTANAVSSQVASHVCALDEWHVKEGSRQEFIEMWRALYSLMEGLDQPPKGSGLLLQSAMDPALHYSLASWSSPQHVKAMREVSAIKSLTANLVSLCSRSECGTFLVVADAPFGAFSGEPIYSYANWRAKTGHEKQFVDAWKKIPKVFATLETPPVGIGHLYQSEADSTLFHSFGPWPSFESLEKMRANERVQAAIGEAAALCTAAAPGAFLVTAVCGPH